MFRSIFKPVGAVEDPLVVPFIPTVIAPCIAAGRVNCLADACATGGLVLYAAYL
jgi:hypothetical protein